ncbi:ceramidase domain-containing protein [Pararhodobacter sp. SW119]|uniref:ceramidase domain-containing protein n=1 Tax=Pararhodobacter sp. SW119 TaxID=2780075 RepID=UPI001ADFD273|nr:ceramidase domain-containing protein [Pararhodobacter sp. SW119]
MDWFAPVNNYCERGGPEYWAEPINAITNAAFLIAALVMASRLRGQSLPLGWAMTVVLAAIGFGSFLFHTHANRLTGLMDVLPILAFILLYIFAATRDFLGARAWVAGLAVLGFFPFAALLVPIFARIPGLSVSAGYAPIPVLILLYAWMLRSRAPDTSRGMARGAEILIVSIIFRSIDQALCEVFPLGTHFLWHILNAVMLGWMIEVYRRHQMHERGNAPRIVLSNASETDPRGRP